MSVILELLTQILVKVGISSSQEEEILTTIKDSNTPPATNEDSRSEDSYALDDEQTFEQEIEEDEEELQQDLSEEKCAYESIIEQWFQVSTRLDKFYFLVSLSLQQQNSFIHVNFYLSFEKLHMNIFLLLLRAWLHWKFDYT
jgi:predicted methyltransferase